MGRQSGPSDVVDAVRRARDDLAALPAAGPGSGSREEWAHALGELQALANGVASMQDAAIAHLAAIEAEVDDSGEVVEVHRAPGHVALDAPAIVSGVLGVSAVHAERRVRAAVALAADGPEGTGTATGLGGLHTAMADGRLDAYRAGVLADELTEAPAEVAASVVAALDPQLGTEDGPRLRRRVRRLLARVSPDLLRRRAVRARSQCRLERWVGEPGVDTWHGTFPSEDAARAWAAVDALAQRHVAEGVCEHLDRARARALTDLVSGNATVEVQVVLTTTEQNARPAPGATSRPATCDSDLVEVLGPRPGEPLLVERGWLDRQAPTAGQGPGADIGGPHDAGTGALLDPGDALATDTYRPGVRLARLVRARDGRCRFPGCQVAARFCDLDHVRSWPAGPTSAANLVCLCRRHHRVKQRPGWRAAVSPDATMTWTDPTGRVRTTRPVDHGELTILPDRGADEALSRGLPSLVLPDGPHSHLEHALEHRPGPRPPGGRRARPGPDLTLHPLRPDVLVDHVPPHRPEPLPDDPPF